VNKGEDTMCTVTLKLDYINQGKQHSVEITCSAKTYQEAYNKAMASAKEFKESYVVLATAVSRIVYT